MLTAGSTNASPHLLHFRPLYFPRVWGGRRLERVFGRTLPDAKPYGESWELVDRDDAQSIVSSGAWAGMSLHELWTTRREEIFGRAYLDSEAARFPLLIKILDCTQDLSLQVHPPAAKAGALGGEPKTEMWFFADADPASHIYAGVKAGVTRETFRRALADGSVSETIHRIDAHRGDSVFVPSGRVHALGGGLLVYEIQQNSDTTYRVFDWNRAGLDGKARELHVDQSMASIDFDDIEPALRRAERGAGVLAECDFFRVTHARTGHHVAPGTLRIIIPISTTTWDGESLAPGQLTCAPASCAAPGPIGEWLEVEGPNVRPV